MSPSFSSYSCIITTDDSILLSAIIYCNFGVVLIEIFDSLKEKFKNLSTIATKLLPCALLFNIIVAVVMHPPPNNLFFFLKETQRPIQFIIMSTFQALLISFSIRLPFFY